MLRDPSSVIVQVAGLASIEDNRVARAALEQATEDYAAHCFDLARMAGVAANELDEDTGGPSSWSVMSLPAGPCAAVDCHDMSPKVVEVFLSVVIDALERSQLSGWRLVQPSWNRLPAAIPSEDAVQPHLCIAQLRVLSSHSGIRVGDWRRDPPAELLREASAWLRRDADPSDRVWGMLGAVSVPTTTGELADVIDARGMNTTAFYVGDEHTLGSYFETGNANCLLASGGPSASTETLVGTARALAALASRSAAVTAYAFIDFARGFEHLTERREYEARFGRQAVSFGTVQWFPERVVHDGCWFQVLSELHFQHLDATAKSMCEPLGLGRYALTVGDPEDWLGQRRDEVWTHARSLIAPLILSEAEVLAELDREERGERSTET